MEQRKPLSPYYLKTVYIGLITDQDSHVSKSISKMLREKDKRQLTSLLMKSLAVTKKEVVKLNTCWAKKDYLIILSQQDY